MFKEKIGTHPIFSCLENGMCPYFYNMAIEKLFIINADIITPLSSINKGTIIIEGERIAEVLPRPFLLSGKEKGELIDARGRWVVPGFIDLHVQGGAGSDTSDGTYEAINTMAGNMARHGTTGFLATLHADIEPIKAIVDAIERGTDGARILGIHLEGPFVNPKKKGVIEERFIEEPSLRRLKEIISIAKGHLKMMTLAPEAEGAGELIRELVAQGIVAAIGHTDAGYSEVMQAVGEGASHVTHLWNCMSGLHHREPGSVGASLCNGRLTVQLIADGVHIHPEIINLVLRTKGKEGIVLITDAIRAVGLPDGEYDSLGRRIIVRQGEARLDDGTLAGSLLTMEKAVRNMRDWSGVSLKGAIGMATLNPARVMGIDDCRGSIEPGKYADITILDKNLNVDLTMVGGKVVWKKAVRD